MSDNITEAREFLKSYLDRNGVNLQEHSAVLVMSEFLNSKQAPSTEPIPVTETDEYKALSEKLVDHDKIKHERDYNWNELQKAKATIAKLQEELKSKDTEK